MIFFFGIGLLFFLFFFGTLVGVELGTNDGWTDGDVLVSTNDGGFVAVVIGPTVGPTVGDLVG